jgi:hypothetical protein
MSVIPINLATEDELSEAVLRRLLEFVGRGYEIGRAYRRGGFGYLRRTVGGWNRAARSVPFIVLTDLDQHTCPRALIDEWLTETQHSNLLFRVAVHEVEAWLLADSRGLSRYLAVGQDSVPNDPESLKDPKGALIDLARKSRSAVLRDRIVPKRGSSASQGPDYNGCLVQFVAAHWDIKSAAANSPSLARTTKRLATFGPDWSQV